MELRSQDRDPQMKSTSLLSLPFVPAALPVLLAVLATAGVASADVTLPKVIGSGMVLQQGKPINLWGRADPGEVVTVTFDGTQAGATADKDGRWLVRLEPRMADSKPRELTISGRNEIVLSDILVGEVWLCSGQSNMNFPVGKTLHVDEEISKAEHPAIRFFRMGKKAAALPQDEGGSDWVACSTDTARNFSAVGYHFGENLHRELKVPVGLILSAVDGVDIEPWTPLEGFEKLESLETYAARVRALTADVKVTPGTPAALYNGMIHPFVPFTMRGVIWYQGEWNCFKGDTAIYTDKTDALISGWRKVFGQEDLSFYFVQIGPMDYSERHWGRKSRTLETLPRFWDAQRACLGAIPRCGMAVITDISGGPDRLHPVFSGPLYNSMSVEGDKVILKFDHADGGLKSLDGGELVQFLISGEDGTFVAAQAEIKGDAVEVRSPTVSNPVAVRYAWHETAVGNLGNKEGLPASPFRTDDWEVEDSKQ
jgi:sialate O-acetylesterase